MKILKQVIDAMIEGSDHNALNKTLVELSFADHPDMVERRKEAQNDAGRDSTSDATAKARAEAGACSRCRCGMSCNASTGRVAPDCAPETCTRRHGRHVRHSCAIFPDLSKRHVFLCFK